MEIDWLTTLQQLIRENVRQNGVYPLIPIGGKHTTHDSEIHVTHYHYTRMLPVSRTLALRFRKGWLEVSMAG